jgi:hypothetical protein
VSTTLPDILQERYGLSPTLTSTALICMGIGSSASVALCNVPLDRVYARIKASRGGIGQPEFRLPIIIVGAFTLPPAVALYGLAAQLVCPSPSGNLNHRVVELLGCKISTAVGNWPLEIT